MLILDRSGIGLLPAAASWTRQRINIMALTRCVMAEIKQMIITRRVHIKIISPHAVNISSVSLSTSSDAGIMIQSYQNKQTLTYHPIRSIQTPLRSDAGRCNGWQARVLTLPLTCSLWSPGSGPGFCLARDHSVAPHPSPSGLSELIQTKTPTQDMGAARGNRSASINKQRQHLV